MDDKGGRIVTHEVVWLREEESSERMRGQKLRSDVQNKKRSVFIVGKMNLR